jgi:hypothetical protein
MTLMITIPPEAEARLNEMARATGADLSAYVSKLVEQAAARATLDELLAPLRRQFAESGVSDEELTEQITAAQAAYRAEQRKQGA